MLQLALEILEAEIDLERGGVLQDQSLHLDPLRGRGRHDEAEPRSLHAGASQDRASSSRTVWTPASTAISITRGSLGARITLTFPFRSRVAVFTSSSSSTP